jgi:cytochrome c
MAWKTPLHDAKALAEKAAAFCKANGKEKRIAEIGNLNGQFAKGRLYVTLSDFNAVVPANPVNPKLVRQNHLYLRNAGGDLFVRNMIEPARAKGGAWVNYAWTNPETRKVQPRKAWVQRVEGADMITLCGVYE